MNLFDELCSEKILELIEKKNEKFPYYDTVLMNVGWSLFLI
jgi:hypothetical protein